MKGFLCLGRRAETKILLASSVTYMTVLTLLPTIALTMAGLVVLLVLTLVAARLFCAMTASPKCIDTVPVGTDTVSIHIATYSEPPEVVCRTLDSLAALDYPNYEVIVLDNNTLDASLYEPVRAHCEKLGSKFRFYHFDNVEGAKAGALNISLGLADPSTEFLLVLDADYQAQPDIISAGLRHFSDSEVGLVQFPQAYRNSSDGCGLTWDYKLFFDVYMNLANRWNTVLSTGTVSFVRRGPLEKSGGWSGDTLTEDAELGLRLHRHGYRGVYVPEVKAAGVMPTDLDSLRAQRRRWVLGNAQSLGTMLREDGFGWRRKLLMALQLTAWASPLLLPLVGLLVGGMVYGLQGGSTALAVASLSLLGIVAYLAGMLAFFMVAVRRQGQSVFTAWRAYLAHLGMLWEASVCWCELFVDSDKSFVRTDKFLQAPRWFATLATATAAVLSGGVGFRMGLGGDSPLVAISLGIFALAISGRAFLRWNLHAIRKRTS